MNQSELNNTWIRWLDDRPVRSEAIDRLVDELKDNEMVLQQLLGDLDTHRQLLAAVKVDLEDFEFVSRMLVRYETSGMEAEQIQPMLTTGPAESRSVVAGPVRRDQRAEVDELPVVTIKTTENLDAKKGKFAWRHLAIALCIPLMGAMLLAAYEMGRHTGQHPTATPEPRNADTQNNSFANQDNNPERQLQDPPNRNVLQSEVIADNTPTADQPDSQQKTNQPGNILQQDGIRISNRPAPDQPLQRQNPTVANNDPTFAKIINDKTAAWAERPSRWPRVGAGKLQIHSGRATIEFDKGGEVTVTGPATFFIKEDNVDVQSGQMAFVLPDLGQDEFSIQASNNRIFPDGIARFQLAVDQQAADLKLERGAVEVNPWHGRLVTHPIELAADGFNQLTIEGDSGDRPAVARLSGPQDQFEGWVNFQDRVLKSTDAKLVDDVFSRAQERFRESPARLAREWKHLTDLASMAKPTGQGELAPPAQRFQPPPEFEEMKERLRQMMEKMQQGDFDAMRGDFQGGFSFAFDGDNMHFQADDMPPEMREQLLGPFADLAERVKQK